MSDGYRTQCSKSNFTEPKLILFKGNLTYKYVYPYPDTKDKVKLKAMDVATTGGHNGYVLRYDVSY